MKNIKGSVLLLIAAFFWGTTFVAQVSGADNLGTFTFNASRCFVGSIFLAIVIVFRDKVLHKKQTVEAKSVWPIKPGIICGVVLFLAMTTQQAGIGLYPENVAASGRSGFLTATYVVMVAVVVSLLKKHVDKLIALAVAGTICGLYFLCMSEGFGSIYKGDILELLCAVCFTAHILVVDRYSKQDSIKLSCIQFITCGAVSLICSLIFDSNSAQDILKAIIPILYAGVLSSGVAYTLQMVGQKYAEPAVASIVMCVESVFAAIAGWIVLSEKLSPREIFGCVLVFISVIVAQLPEFKRKDEDGQ